jgi:SOS-response transcriptional repressor LexA
MNSQRGAMSTEKRAYLAKSIGELEQIAAVNSGDEKIIEKIKQELEHRTTAKARRLLDALKSGESIHLTPQSKPSAMDAESGSVFKDCDVLLVSYELLRSTFGERGELLSRWGLTDSMPLVLLEKIGLMWIDELTTGYKHAIRTNEQLIKDFTQLGVSLPTSKRI